MRRLAVWASVVAFVSGAWACGGGAKSSMFSGDGGANMVGPDGGAGPDASVDAEMFVIDDGGSSGGDASSSGSDATLYSDAPAGLSITPSGLQTLTVTVGQAAPMPTFTALLSGVPVSAAWGVDRGDVGVVPAGPATAVAFAASGTTGGLVTITAGFNGQTATVQVFVKLSASQNGATSDLSEQPQIATSVAQLTAGGGVGGVGGEGLGGPVTDMGTLQALQNPSSDGSAEGLAMLYPYDQTVWPRGILAPLVQWTAAFPASGDAGVPGDGGAPADASASGDAGGMAGGGAPTTAAVDAIQMTLATTSGSYSWTGTFGPPPILGTTGGSFVRMPIPQDVWAMATNTAGGLTPDKKPDQLVLSLVVAKDGVGYGPITETWPVAPGLLSGIIYYNSYGTDLAKNYGGAVGGDGTFGAAVLSIHVGDTAPRLVAGGSGTTDGSQCRVCHSVAAQGSRLSLQQFNGGADNISSAYDLTPTGAVEHVQPNNIDWFPAVYPDGSLALSKEGTLYALPDDTTTIATTGLTAFTDLGTPSFSPDGTQVAANPTAGPMVTSAQQLYVMSYGAKTNAFGVPVLVADYGSQPISVRPGWPAFFPDGLSLVFQLQSQPGIDGVADDLRTRKGALAQIAWTSTSDAQHVGVLNRLNGLDAAGSSVLPTWPSGMSMNCQADGAQVGQIDPTHANDANMNYEPTVNPVATGGYVWVVFTSRRMYGSEATIPPFCSDPRGVDLVQNITTKKLWVAAVDLGAPAGADASHPAFYLPGQELLAGNSRAFWVLDPCLTDGTSCTAGDQCCNGYCEPGGDAGGLVCLNSPPDNRCAAINDKCSSPADCCDTTNICVNGFCSMAPVSGGGLQ